MDRDTQIRDNWIGGFVCGIAVCLLFSMYSCTTETIEKNNKRAYEQTAK